MTKFISKLGRLSWTAATFLVALVLLSCCLHANPLDKFWKEHFTRLDFRMEAIQGSPRAIQPIDIDRDGNDEMLVVEEDLFYILAHDGYSWLFTCWQSELRGAVALRYSDGDSLRVLYCLQTDTVEHWCSLSNNDFVAPFDCGPPSHRLCDHPLRSVQGEMAGVMGPNLLVDCNSDAVLDIIFDVYSGKFGLQPRGVMSVDGRSGQELWHLWFGPAASLPIAADLVGDARSEILVGGSALDNGSEAGGYNDSLCYLFAIDLNGKFVWDPLRIGRKLTDLSIDLIRRGTNQPNDIAVAVRGGQVSSDSSKLLIISGGDGRVRRSINSPAGLTRVYVFKQPGDSALRLLTSDIAGFVRLYDTSLVLLDSFVCPSRAEVSIYRPLDLDGDSICEIALADRNNSLWILDRNLDPIFSRQFSSPVGVFSPLRTTEPGVAKFVLCVGQDPRQWYICSVSRVDLTLGEIITVPYRIGAVAVVLTSVLVIAGLSLVQRRRRALAVLSAIFNDRTRIVIGLDHKGRLFKLNEGARTFFDTSATLLGKHYHALQDDGAYAQLVSLIDGAVHQSEPSYEGELRLMHRGLAREFLVQITRFGGSRYGLSPVTTVSLQDITRVSQEKMYESWDVFSSSIAHDLRKPLSPLTLLLQDLGARLENNTVDPNQASNRYISPALLQIDQMTRLVDRLQVASNPDDAPKSTLKIGEIVRYVVTMKRSIVGGNVELLLKDECDEATVTGNREDLERVIGELIDNACCAVEGTPRPRVEVSGVILDGGAGQTRIEIRDNGKGIPADLLPRIFEPGYTTGQGGHRGLGLFTARRVITQHGGTVEVESQVGVGTTFAIVLPLARAKESQ